MPIINGNFVESTHTRTRIRAELKGVLYNIMSYELGGSVKQSGRHTTGR